MEGTSTVVVKVSFIPNELPSSKHDGRSGTQLQYPSSPLCGNPNMYWYGEEGEKGTTSGPVYIPPVHSDYPSANSRSNNQYEPKCSPVRD
jgi:hypothetical protein